MEAGFKIMETVEPIDNNFKLDINKIIIMFKNL